MFHCWCSRVDWIVDKKSSHLGYEEAVCRAGIDSSWNLRIGCLAGFEAADCHGFIEEGIGIRSFSS